MSTSEEAFLTAAYYYSSLYNSPVLFAASPDYLDSLTGPSFDPVFELCAEYEYAFSYPAFDTNFATGKVSETLKDELLIFKSRVDNLSSELWTWKQIISNASWNSIRHAADELLTKMGKARRTYDFAFTVNIPSL